MVRATVTEVKARLSAYIDQVRAGETVVILDRGVPVATMEPPVRHDDAAGRLVRLERAGTVNPGSIPPPTDVLRTPGPRLPQGTSAVDAVLRERDDGR